MQIKFDTENDGEVDVGDLANLKENDSSRKSLQNNTFDQNENGEVSEEKVIKL